MPKPKLPSGQTVVWAKNEHPTVYANLMAFAMSPFDITLIFGQIGDASDEEVTAIPQAKVIISPEQALNLQRLLGVAVAGFVTSNGELRKAGALDPEAVQKELESRKRPLNTNP